MQGYIIICSTNTHSLDDFNNLSNALASFTHISEWSIDLTDSEKVLRMETTKDITIFLIAGLKKLGIQCKVMGIFMNK